MALSPSIARRGRKRSTESSHQAIIDIGSNTVRMVIFGGAPRAPVTLFNEKVVARLGRDLEPGGGLSQDAMDLALEGLARYAQLLSDLEIERVDAVATAAVRDASNGEAFLNEVRALGLSPRLLSGKEEAEVSAMGVIGAFPGVGEDSSAVVADLGGGSIEFTRISGSTFEERSSLPLGTLRLLELAERPADKALKSIAKKLGKAGWGEPIHAPLYLVGGIWRAMAVYAMESRNWPLSDPHGYTMKPKEALALAKELTVLDPKTIGQSERISAMRAQQMPAAALLLRAMVEQQEPERLVISAWGLREGLLFEKLDAPTRRADPLMAALDLFAAQRGLTHSLAARVSAWTVGAVPAGAKASERIRLAATKLALASMSIEPNLRQHQAMDWALHKRWIGLDDAGRAMVAMAIAANGNHTDIPQDFMCLAREDQLNEAICWGLATRLCRRLGALAPGSLENSHLSIEGGRLVLEIAPNQDALLFGPTGKDMALLADRLDLKPEMRVLAGS